MNVEGSFEGISELPSFTKACKKEVVYESLFSISPRADCTVRFFVRCSENCAAILSYCKRFSRNMTEKMRASSA